jgi:pyruvate/2-oxoglutarate dehydrogenase complex dihydrolipoamide dehydrogenase (E3) component
VNFACGDGDHHGNGLMQGADRDLVKVWQKMNAKRFDNIMLKTKTVSARALPEGIEVTFAPAEEGVKVPEPQVRPRVASRGPHAQRQKTRR